MRNKGIIFYVTGRYMRKNKKRTITAWGGIVFMIMLLTTVLVGKNTVLSYFAEMASEKNGSWHAKMDYVNDFRFQKVMNLKYIDEVAVFEEYGYTLFQESGNPEKPYLYVDGYSENCFDWLNVTLTEGRFPEQENEIVLSEAVLKDGGKITLGDWIDVDYFQRRLSMKDAEEEEGILFPYYNIRVYENTPLPRDFPYYGDTDRFTEIQEPVDHQGTYRVVGFIKDPGTMLPDSAAYTAYCYINNEIQKEDNTQGKRSMYIRFDLEQLNGTVDYRNDLKKINPLIDAVEINTLVLQFSSGMEGNVLSSVAKFLMLFFVAFTMAVSVILIYNVFRISQNERSHYIGMLSSVGATVGQRQSSVYFEAGVLWLTALPVGILAGTAALKGVMWVLQPYMEDLVDYAKLGFVVTDSIPLVILPETLALIAIVSGITVVLATMIPAYQVGKTGPVESIKGTEGVRKRKSSNLWLDHMNGEYMLAMSHLTRQKTKSGSLVCAMVAFLVVLVISSFGASTAVRLVHIKLKGYDSLTANTDQWDYVIQEWNGESLYTALKKELYADAGVEALQEWALDSYRGKVSEDAYSREYWEAYHALIESCYPDNAVEMEQKFAESRENYVTILGLDEESFQALAEKCDCDTDLPAPAIVYQEGMITSYYFWISGTEAPEYQICQLQHMTDRKVGESIGMKFGVMEEELEYEITVAGFATEKQLAEYASVRGDCLCVIVGMDTIQELEQQICQFFGHPSHMSRELHIRLSDTDTGVERKLQSLSDEAQGNIFITVEKAGLDSKRNTIARALEYIIWILLVSFVGLISLICILSLYNAICARAVMRKQEFAILESVGMTRKQRNRMLLYENAGLFLKGVVWSAVISIPLTQILKVVLAEFLGYPHFSYPWQMLVCAWIAVAAVLFGVTAYCYRHKEEETLITRIREEEV